MWVGRVLYHQRTSVHMSGRKTTQAVQNWATHISTSCHPARKRLGRTTWMLFKNRYGYESMLGTTCTDLPSVPMTVCGCVNMTQME